MEIQEIKSRLTITEVAKHFGIQIGKNHKACCPFHSAPPLARVGLQPTR